MAGSVVFFATECLSPQCPCPTAYSGGVCMCSVEKQVAATSGVSLLAKRRDASMENSIGLALRCTYDSHLFPELDVAKTCILTARSLGCKLLCDGLAVRR